MAEAVWRVRRPDPEADFDRPVSDVLLLAYHFAPHDEAQEALRLLESKKSERIADHRGYAAVLAPKSVEEDGEDQRAVERFGLAAARRKVKKARCQFIAFDIEGVGIFLHPGCEGRNVGQDEGELK